MMQAFTVFCAKGRVGTYHTRKKAEAIIADVKAHPEKYLHIQEWTPAPHHEAYVTFEDNEFEEEE